MKSKKRLLIGGLALAVVLGATFAVLQIPSVQMKLMEQADLGTLQGWVADNPNDWRTQYWYGKRAAEAGDFIHAEPALRAAFGTREDFLPAGTELGKLLLATGRVEEAFQVLRLVIGRDAGQKDAQIALAQLYRSQGAEHRSMEILRRVLEQSPRDKVALFELGAAHEGVAQLTQAEPPLRACLKEDPRFVPGLILLARVKRRQGDIADARKWAEEAVRWGAAQPNAHLELARALAATNPLPENREKAIADLEGFLEQVPNHPGIRLELGQLYLKRGDFQAAGKQFEEVVRLQPDRSVGYFHLSQALAGLGQREAEKRVRAIFTRLEAYERRTVDLGAKIGANPNSADLRYQLGELHVENGRPDRAVQAYRLGLQRDRGNDKARKRLIELMERARRGPGQATGPGSPHETP